MNFPKIASRRQRILQYLLFLGTAIAIVVGLAHTQGTTSRILIDGKVEPDRIPDCVLWNQIFQLAVQLNETSPAHGQEIWIDELNLSEKVMKEIIAQGYDHLEMLDDMDQDAKNQISNASKDDYDLKNHPNKREALKGRLKKIQLDKEARTLEMRDKLRDRIGDDAFLRLSSFARLQIATRTRIGG